MNGSVPLTKGWQFYLLAEDSNSWNRYFVEIAIRARILSLQSARVAQVENQKVILYRFYGLHNLYAFQEMVAKAATRETSSTTHTLKYYMSNDGANFVETDANFTQGSALMNRLENRMLRRSKYNPTLVPAV